MSSLVDNWLKLRLDGPGGESGQYLSIIKIRGVKHSREEFILDFSKNGLRIIDDGDNYFLLNFQIKIIPRK